MRGRINLSSSFISFRGNEGKIERDKGRGEWKNGEREDGKEEKMNE